MGVIIDRLFFIWHPHNEEMNHLDWTTIWYTKWFTSSKYAEYRDPFHPNNDMLNNVETNDTGEILG